MKALVTGGGGFLGGAIVRMLLDKGDTVRSFSRSSYAELDALGVETVRGDLADSEAVSRAAEGCDTVFHVAAKAGVWGAYDDYYKANVAGTENIIQACGTHGIPKLVYTSTPSVTFKGSEDGVDESEPYAENFLCHYAATKTVAEKAVLAANSDELATVALRPHLIWGPGDTNLVPRIISRAKSGKLFIIGDGSNKVDSTYIDNAAEAHVLASSALEPGAPCAGKAYFITNGEPLTMRDLLNKILAAAELPKANRSIPPRAAYAIGAVMEAVFGIIGIKQEPKITRFVARQLSTAHWYDISAAKRDFGYEPRVSIDEGMKRLAEWLNKSGDS